MGRSGRVNLSTCACQKTNTHTVHSNLARVHPPRAVVAVAVAVLVAHRVVAASEDLIEALATVEAVLGAVLVRRGALAADDGGRAGAGGGGGGGGGDALRKVEGHLDQVILQQHPECIDNLLQNMMNAYENFAEIKEQILNITTRGAGGGGGGGGGGDADD